jgi:NAD(P)-dependent dehydrogenase (short-subunit alcohol dehydrogenase family)
MGSTKSGRRNTGAVPFCHASSGPKTPVRSQNSVSISTMVALMTGSTSDLGHEVALRLAARGSHVIVHGRDTDRRERVVKEIEQKGGKARSYNADFAKLADVRQLALSTRRRQPFAFHPHGEQTAAVDCRLNVSTITLRGQRRGSMVRPRRRPAAFVGEVAPPLIRGAGQLLICADAGAPLVAVLVHLLFGCRSGPAPRHQGRVSPSTVSGARRDAVAR